MVLNLIVKGIVMTKLWNWFVSPYFGIIEITLVIAIGIALVYAALSMHTPSKELNDIEPSTIIQNHIFILINYFFVLFVGWVLTFFL